MSSTDDSPPDLPTDETRTHALRDAIEALGEAVFLQETIWFTELRRCADRIDRTAQRILSDRHAEAVTLMLDMQLDLLEFLPNPLIVPEDPDARHTCPEERRRAVRDLVSVARFAQWLLHRDYGAQPQDLARLFDFSDLERETRAFCEVLSRLEREAAARAKRAGSVSTVARARLRLVHDADRLGGG